MESESEYSRQIPALLVATTRLERHTAHHLETCECPEDRARRTPRYRRVRRIGALAQVMRTGSIPGRCTWAGSCRRVLNGRVIVAADGQGMRRPKRSGSGSTKAPTLMVTRVTGRKTGDMPWDSYADATPL